MIASVYKSVQFPYYEIGVKFMAKLYGESFDLPYWDKSLYSEAENEEINKVCESAELLFEFETIVIF